MSLRQYFSRLFRRPPTRAQRRSAGKVQGVKLRLEVLEDRTAPAVATLSAGVLTIDYSAAAGTAEAVVVTNNGSTISLTGNVSGATSNAVGNVTRIAVTDSSSGNANQSVTFAGNQAYSLSSGLSST